MGELGYEGVCVEFGVGSEVFWVGLVCWLRAAACVLRCVCDNGGSHIAIIRQGWFRILLCWR